MTLYEKDGVTVIATETQDTLELAVSEPDPINLEIQVDQNQNGQIDRYIDHSYGVTPRGKLCSAYLINGTSDTACGGCASSAHLKAFKDADGRRQYTLVLPKKELSLGQQSVKLALNFFNSAQKSFSVFPPERFQHPISVPFAILPVGAAHADLALWNEHPQLQGSGRTLWSETGNGVGLGFGASTSPEPNPMGGLYRVGGNVSAPIELNKVEAEFTDTASRANYQGICVISVIVDAKGDPENPIVVLALGMGLDEKALDAVRKYKFKPAMKDGKTPVSVMILVEVNFRLYTPTR
jgi:TonB family protein